MQSVDDLRSDTHFEDSSHAAVYVGDDEKPWTAMLVHHLMESTNYFSCSKSKRLPIRQNTGYFHWKISSRMVCPKLRSKQMTSRRALNTFMSEFKKLTGTEGNSQPEAAVEGKYRMATSDECAEIRRAIDHVRQKERQKLKRAAELARKRKRRQGEEEAAAAAKAAKEERARKLAEEEARKGPGACRSRGKLERLIQREQQQLKRKRE